MKTSEILNRAADLIEEHGWGQGGATWKDVGAGLCLEGGIVAAMGVDMSRRMAPPEGFEKCSAYRAVWDFLQDDDRWGFFRNHLYNWNDERTRTAEEVIEVLRAAAVIEASREAELAKVSA